MIYKIKEFIEEMNQKMNEGFDAVLARRKSRIGETFIKKLITKVGYKLIEKITDIKIPKNTKTLELFLRE